MKKTRLSFRKCCLALILGVLVACSPNEDEKGNSIQDNFDRAAMLSHWADDYIMPAYQDYHAQTRVLNTAAQAYIAEPNAANHAAVHKAFRQTYRAWQWVSFLEIGPAEQLSLRNLTNIYPTSGAEIEQALGQSSYNLDLPSTFNEQGLPAIDYVLSGLGNPNTTNSAFSNNANYGRYLQALTQRLENLSSQVLGQWQNGYRQSFISNTSASATASANKLINDFVFHFEKELRAGKVGIPAGVFSGGSLDQNVEAYYSDTLSRSLFLESLRAHKAFFRGWGFKEQNSGNSLQAYLDYLNVKNQDLNLSDAIFAQMESAHTQAEALPASFADAVRNQNTDLLNLYDELQKAVILLKVDMMQALNVRIDYIDADGD